MITMILMLIAQIKFEGFEEAAQQNTLFAVLVSIVLVLFGISVYLFKLYVNKNSEIKIINAKNSENLLTLQKNHTEKIDKIRLEIMDKDAELNKQWRESEKETLIVLKGVNTVLEMSEKMKENDTEKIIDKIHSLEKTGERYILELKASKNDNNG